MARNRTRRSALRFINAGFYLVCVVAAGLALRPVLVSWWIILTQPFSYVEPLPSPLLYGPLLLALGATATLAIGRAIAGDPPRRLLSGSVFALTAAVLLLQLLLPVRIPRSARPAEAKVADAVETLARAVEEGRALEGSDLLLRLPGPSPYHSYGHRLPWNVVSEAGVGPRLQARPGDLPGTLYVVRGYGAREYWLTALAMEGAPTGRLVFARTPEGRPLIRRVKP